MTNAPIKHRMTRRLTGWDYCQRAIYMITVTLEDRSREWLGSLVYLAENGEALNCGTVPPHCGTVPPHSCGGNCGFWSIVPTPYGQAVLEALEAMPQLYPQVRILAHQLMPEHFHFIVFVESPLPKPLGALVRGFKAGAAKRWKALSPSGNALPRWADGFQDTILFRQGQLQTMIEYLRANPERLAEKRANPDLFRRVASLSLPLDGGRFTGHFEALGNRHLLSRPMHQVQCSRQFFAYQRVPKAGGGLKIARTSDDEPVVARTSPEYEMRLADALDASAHGAVVLSPCISDGERQIAREALVRERPLIAFRNMGFSKLEKPVGRLFKACAEGRILLLAPAAWPYSTQEKPMTRFDATVLNRLCQWLAGEDAVDINYHGMTPANIDQLALNAVLASK